MKNAGSAMPVRTMSIMDSLETAYPFWAANRQCAPMMETVAKEGLASLEIAITRSAATPQSAPMANIAIMESAGIHVLIHQTVLRSRQVISANMDCAVCIVTSLYCIIIAHHSTSYHQLVQLNALSMICSLFGKHVLGYVLMDLNGWYTPPILDLIVW